MKLVIGAREFNLGWRDGMVLGGSIVAVCGLWIAFGFGIVVAIIGACVAAFPFLRVELAPRAAVPPETPT